MQELRLNIEGMSCANCEQRIERTLLSLPGVMRARVSLRDGAATLTFDPAVLTDAQIVQAVEKLGYRVGAASRGTQRVGGVLVLIVALFVLIQMLGASQLVSAFPLVSQDMGYVMLFVIGVLTSLHCLFMCGGINLSVCLPQASAAAPPVLPAPAAATASSAVSAGAAPSASPKAKARATSLHPSTSLPPALRPSASLRPSLLYNLGRVAGYTAVGALVGALGAILTPTGVFKGVIQLVAGIFMVVMGLSMLGVLPTLRLPIKALNLDTHRSKGPLVIGLLNALMPCGPLQAMQLYALSTGSALVGALSMLAFALGTAPLMLALGALGTSLSRRFTTRAMRVGAVLICVMGLFMFSTGFTLSGFTNPMSHMFGGGGNGPEASQVTIANGYQAVDSTLGRGYPDITVTAGMPVRWTIEASEDAINGCNNRMYIPEYGIEHSFTPGANLIEFTPTEAGTYTYSCWMGMITGKIVVT